MRPDIGRTIKAATHLSLDAVAACSTLWVLRATYHQVADGRDHPLSAWWLATALTGIAGATIGWGCFASGSGRQALRLAAVCALLGCSFAWSPDLVGPTPAALCRVLLPLALRRALRMRFRPSWAAATLAGALAAGLWPVAVDLAAMAALLAVLVEAAAPYSGIRWARGVAACMALPAVLALASGLGLVSEVLVSGLVHVAAIAAILWCTVGAADTCNHLPGRTT